VFRFYFIIVVAVICSCAQHPQNIKPVYSPQQSYETLSCNELEREQDIVHFKIRELFLKLGLEDKRDKYTAASGIIFPPALFKLEGKTLGVQKNMQDCLV